MYEDDKQKANNAKPNQQANNNLTGSGTGYSDRLERLDRLYGESLASNKAHKRNVKLATIGLALGAVAAVVVPIVVYNSVKKEGNYYVQVESNAPNFERYGITLKQGSTIKSLKDKLNIFEGHELVNIYKDEACTIPYADSDKIERNTVVYLEYRKLKYSVNIPDDMSSGYIVSYDKGLIDEDGKIEYGTTLTFKVDAISDNGYEKKDNFAVKVNGNTISADSEGNYIIDISEATEIVVEGVGLKTYSLNNLPKGVTVYSENQNKNLTLEDEIVYGDNLNFSYIVTEGYEKSVFKVNGKDCSGSSYKFVVTNSNMGDSEEITVEYVETRINYAVNIPEEKADDGFTIVLPTEDFDNGHFAVGEDIKVNWGNTFKFNVVVDQGYKIPVVTLTSEVVAGINLIPVATSTQQNKTIYTYQVDSIKQGINIDVSVDKEVYVVYFSDKDGLKNKSVEYGTILSAIAPTVNNYSTDSHNYQFKCWAVYTGETEYEEINASTYKITAQTIFTAIYTETIKTYSYMASTTNCSASFVVERDGENVEISLENPKVQYGDVIKISNIKPNEGYKDDVSINVLGATYNDNKGGWVVDNSHTGVVVSVEAISQENKSVTLVQGDGYKLTFKEGYSASVVYGGECVVLVTPDEGYVLTGFSVDETDKFVQGKTEYTLSEITHDTTISATAELISYTLKVESDTQDSVIVTRTSTDSEDTATTLKNGDTVYYWDELTISYTEPGEGYIKTEFSINGSDVDGVSKNITLNKDWVTNGELVVKYSQQALKYKVELPQGEGYTITYSKDITTLEEFTIEDSFTFEVVAETGYKLSEDGVVITTGAQLTKNSTGNYTISNFTDNVSITVNVQLETYDIEIPMSDYGYYSFNQIIRDAEGNITKKAVDVSKISVQYNKVLELEFVIQEGYTTADGLAPKIMIDNTTEIVKNSDNFYAYTVKNSGVINVVANFVKKAYTIKLDVDAQLTADDYELTFTNSNYSVGATVEHGTTEVTFIFRLTNEKYSGYDVAVDGGEYRKVIDGVYTISNVVGDASGNLVIKILNPVIKTYQITESDTNIESLVFEGTEKVVYGENATFTIKLSDAYNKYQLTEDNLTIVGNYSSFSIINNVCTIVNVTSDITISVKDIVKNTYTITDATEIKEGYTLTINDSEVTHGEGTTITFSLKEGYTDSSAIIKINGEEITLSDGQYVIENITADQQIIVQDVEKNKYAVKFVNPDGTTAAESQEIKYQEYAETPAEPTFEETPQYRYEFKGWALVNGGEMVTVGDIQITEATTFIAQYDEIAIEYTITLPETMQNYSITYDKTEYPEDIKLTCEDEFAFTIVLDEGYDEDVPEVTIDETKATLTSVGANQYTITNIQGNVTINVAEPKINEYVLTFEELENCDITVTRDGEELNNNAVVKHGDELIITYTTTDGYKIEGLTVTNTIEEDGVYKVTGDVNISYQIGQFKNILLNVDGKQANIYLEEDTDLLLGIEGKTEYNDETTCGWYYEPTLQTPVQSGTTVTEGIEIYTRKATVDKLSFEENSDGTWKVGMASSEEEGDIVVPRMHQGKTVTYINAFYGNAITGLVIPNTINSYRDEGGLIIIGSLRENLTSIIVVGDNTTFDSRPVDNVNNAPSNAIIETATDTLLAGCQATTIPTNVKKIRKDAMYSAGFKGSLQIPASVTEIGEDAFVSNPEMTEVHIYGKINEIANGLFSGCSSLANIEIADSSSITRIGESAFNGCTSLTSFNVPANVTEIGEVAFYSAGLTEIVLPESLQTISRQAFRKTALTSIIIPHNVSTIGDYAFYECESLTAVYFMNLDDWTADSTAISDDDAGNFSLMAQHFTTHPANEWTNAYPESTFVEGVDDSWFVLNSDGESYAVRSGSTTLPAQIVIPKTWKGLPVTRINERAFYNNDTITSVRMPNTITTISNEAFYRCSGITELLIPEGVTNVNVGSFGFIDAPSQLTKLRIPSTMTSMYTWYDPEEGASTYDYVCFKNLSIHALNPALGSRDELGNDCNMLIDKSTATLIRCYYNYQNIPETTTLTIPSNVKTIKTGAFVAVSRNTSTYAEMLDITVSEGVEVIEDGAFSSVRGKYLNLPSTLTEVGELQHCDFYHITIGEGNETFSTDGQYIVNDNTKTLIWTADNTIDNSTIPAGVETIGSYAFSHYSKTLISSDFAIPSHIKHIGNYAFRSAIFGQYVGEDLQINQTDFVIPGNVETIGDYAFFSVDGLKDLVIEEGVTTIGEYAFSNTSIQSIYIPASVSAIGVGILNNCPNLTSIIVSDDNPYFTSKDADGIQCNAIISKDTTSQVSTTSVNEMFTSVREAMPRATTTSWAPNTMIAIQQGLSEVTIPKGVEKIASGVFGNNITSITIPASITEIGDFSGYTGLESVIFAEGSQLTAIPENMFNGCTNLKSITIPASVTSIGTRAFYGCENLTNVYFEEGSKLTTIGSSVFYGCDMLEEITIPASVTTIGREAFLGGSSSGFNIYFEPGTQITTFLYRTFGSHVNMIIPASVTTIEKEAFYGCKGNITFENVEGWKYSNMEVSAGDLGCYGEAVKYLGTDYYGHQWTRTDIAGEIELNDSICELNAEQSYYIIKDGSSLSGEIIIPAMYKGLPVKEIGANAFKNNLNITKVTLPGTLLVIGDSAFYGCTNLTSVYMSHNVTTIGDSAFYMCSALDVEDSFSSSMKDIGNDAFAGCSSLTSAGLGRALKLTTIGDSAFAGCTKLNWFTSLSSTEFSIGSKAFENCTSLEEVYAYNLSELGDEAFVGCSALTDLYLNGAEITSIGYGVFKDCVNLNIATLPSTVTAIGDYAFYNCKSLNLTELSTDIKTIGNYAFYNCTALTADIPALVSTIGDYAFYGTSITTVNRLQAIETVGDYAFAGCTNLERFEFMPITLPRFGVHVFDGCESLIYKTYDNAYYLGQYDFNDACYLLVKAVNTNITSCTINTNAYIILDSAFEGCSNLTSISIPSATRYIGSNAFSGCTNLNSVTLEDRYYWEISNGENTQVILPSSLEDANAVAIAFIDVYCDYSWTKIEDVETFTLTYTEQPNSTMTILRNGEVYDGTEIKWGDVLTVTFTADEGYKIENYSFSNSEGTLEHKNGVIDVTSDITITYEVVEGITEEMLENGTLGDNWYTLNADGASYSVKKGGETLTDEVVIIGRKHKGLPVTAILDGTGTSSNGVFNNQMMDNIIIPNTVTSIGQFAFYGCTSLNSITIPNSVTTIGNDAFVRCWQMAEVIFEENSQLATIGNDTFSGCTALRSITIPQSVTSIDISAFKGCTQLHTVKFEENSMLTSLGTYVFENCEALTTINIPSALTTISQYTFSGCINLQNVQFDEESQLTTISSNAFYNCTGLQNLTIPKSVLKIEANAFYGCTGISSVTFGNTDNWIVELNGVVTNLYDEHLSNTTTAAGYLRSHLTEHTWEYIVYPEATLLDESWYQFDGSAFHVVRGTSGFPADGNVVIPKMFTKNGKTAPVVQIDAFAFNGNSNLVSITLPSTVKIIASQAFFQSSLTSINMTKGLETIASQAFAYCDELTSINLPSTVTTISERAFEYCLFLESAEISGNVGARAFDHCGSLQTVTLNANLGTIGEYAFAYCTKLTTVKNLGRVKTIEGYAFYNCEISSYSVYVSLSDVETIGEYAFAWNSLTLVRFGKNLKSVDPTAFYQNGSLEGIIVDSENTTYTSTYNGVECNAIIEIATNTLVIGGSDMTEIPEGIETIGDYAFYGRYIESMHIPKSVTSIGIASFGTNCLFFNTITVDGNNPVYTSKINNIECNGIFTKDGTTLVVGCSATVLDGIKTIGAYAFCNVNLSSIVLPSGVSTIGEYAFKGSSLTSIILPNSVYKIGCYAFADCADLRLVTFDHLNDPDYNYQWYKTSSSTSWESTMDGEWLDIDLTAPSQNAIYLKNTYADYYLYALTFDKL